MAGEFSDNNPTGTSSGGRNKGEQSKHHDTPRAKTVGRVTLLVATFYSRQKFLNRFGDNSRIEARQKERPLPEGVGALELLQMVYRGEVKVSPQQMRAAIEALLHESPRMSAVAVGYLTGDTFAERLERAIARYPQPRFCYKDLTCLKSKSL